MDMGKGGVISDGCDGRGGVRGRGVGVRGCRGTTKQCINRPIEQHQKYQRESEQIAFHSHC